MGHSRSDPCAGLSFYDNVRRYLSTIIPWFSLEYARADVMRSYETLCRESLAFPLNKRPPFFSRINHDGTPFQFALSLGHRNPALQFLSETAPPDMSSTQRIQLSRRRIHSLAAILGIREATSRLSTFLDRLAPVTNPELLADGAGAFWIGVAFAYGESPQLRLYINARWGCERDRWSRLDWLASQFGGFEEWQELRSGHLADLQPLGMALTLCGDRLAAGRIYLSAYGKRLSDYELLLKPFAHDSFNRAFQRFGKHILGEDRYYPTQSAVCSFGFAQRQTLDAKLELCGHCFFPDDLAAADRISKWLESLNVDPSPYVHTLAAISGGCLSETSSDLHCYVGVGVKEQETYFSVYLKPRMITLRGTA